MSEAWLHADIDWSPWGCGEAIYRQGRRGGAIGTVGFYRFAPRNSPPCGVGFILTSLIIFVYCLHPSRVFEFFFNVVLNIHPGVGHTAHKPFQVVNARAGIQDILQKKDAEEAPCQMGLPGAVESMPKLVPRDTGLLQPIIVNCSYQQKDWELLHIVTLFSIHFPLVFWVVEKGGHLRWRRHRSIDLPFPASF